MAVQTIYTCICLATQMGHHTEYMQIRDGVNHQVTILHFCEVIILFLQHQGTILLTKSLHTFGIHTQQLLERA